MEPGSQNLETRGPVSSRPSTVESSSRLPQGSLRAGAPLNPHSNTSPWGPLPNPALQRTRFARR